MIREHEGNLEVVLITGASSGIGKAIAIEYAKKGKNLVIVARSREKLEELAHKWQKEFGINVYVISQDLTDLNAVSNIKKFTQEHQLSVTYLINNAGFGLWGEFLDLDWERELKMIYLNIRALTELTKEFLPQMVERGKGKILNVASTAALQPVPYMAVYGGTKAYVLSFTEALAEEYGSIGVDFMALLPGYTKTGFQAVSKVNKSKYTEKESETPESVAKYAVKRLEKGEIVGIHQFKDRILAFLLRLLPRKTIRKFSKKAMSAKDS